MAVLLTQVKLKILIMSKKLYLICLLLPFISYHSLHCSSTTRTFLLCLYTAKCVSASGLWHLFIITSLSSLPRQPQSQLPYFFQVCVPKSPLHRGFLCLSYVKQKLPVTLFTIPHFIFVQSTYHQLIYNYLFVFLH